MVWRLNRIAGIPAFIVIVFYTLSLVKLIARLNPEDDVIVRDEAPGISPVFALADEEVVIGNTDPERDGNLPPATTTNSSLTSEVKMLHVLSYQRSGSSFVGRLFDAHPNAFFIYEPLSMLFTALYGIMEDRAIPNNIFFDHYGNFRNLSDDQSKLMTWTVRNIFECRLSEFPTAMLISNFWYRYQDTHMSIGKDYVKCMEPARHLNFSGGDEGLGVCLEHIRKPCPRSYNTLDEGLLNRCRSILWHNDTWSDTDSDELWAPYEGQDFMKYRQNFRQYFTCLKSLEPRVRQCARGHLDTPCKNAELRVVKTVRAPIELSRILFEAYPDNFNLIHLLRDPRGVTLSRLRAEWAHGYFERQDPDPRVLSDSYCRNAQRDVDERQALEAEHGDHIKELVYDHFMGDLRGNGRSIFKMLGMEGSVRKINHIIEGKADIERKDRWKTWLKLADIRAIEKACPWFMHSYNLTLYEENRILQ
ncbi:hypothetical protein CAPTEDRAFT_200321 [Capitella teleta]|uniref:Sulfotransferase domain-containing protein n=1 Tax=Capitella teleta TaxID=283909 RepID=R7V184_CAPTE|nr:hypothetical protein CAPTEDRAFT_200321 [Capitella teleta]|eukprot:ELU09456.1 hypothetical protein CAPTEDRAFT_200321 [Capitella teleta]